MISVKVNENKQLFKDTNPEAYSELKEAYVYNMDLKLDELAADSEALGLFICKERQHHYIEPINQRSNPEYDIGCPVCKAELLNITLFKAKQRIYRQTRYDLVENLWICKKCRKAWWSSRNSDDYVVTSHKEYCVSDDDSVKPLSQTHPALAEEYSKSNPYDLDWISYSGWYDFDEPLKWKCSKCNHEYDMLFKRKVLFGDKACPYCNGILPTYEHSLAYLYPEIAEEWDKREQAIKKSSREIFGDKIGERRAHGIETLGMIQCKRCGVIHLRKIEDVINDKCIFCDQGASFEWTEKVFREKGVYAPDEYYCEYKAEAIVETFTCEECGNIFTANLMNRLIRKYTCLGCENRSSMHRYNLFKITYPDLMKEWDYTNNYLLCNPDYILDNHKQKVWWICSDCGHRYLMTPKRRVLLWRRKMKACPYEKGFRRKKHYYYYV